MRLGERLIAEGHVTPEQLDRALRGQVVHGGRLGTNLVERLMLPIDVLAEALGRHHGIPAATQRHFERSDQAVQKRIPPELAAKWHAIPIGFISNDPPQIAVAATDPLPEEGVAALTEALGAKIILAIAPELRVLFYLEKVYGVQRLNRFIRLPSERTGTDIDNRRRYVSTVDESIPAAPSALARVAIRQIAVPHTGELNPVTDIDSLDVGIRAMRRCNSRSRLGMTLLHTLTRVLVPPLSGVMIMLIRGGVASGWKGVIPEGAAQVVESIAFRLESEPTLFQCVERKSAARGTPALEASVNLWAALQVSTPAEVIAAPACLGERTVAALYGFSSQPIGDDVAEGVTRLARALGSNFERLLRAAER